MKIGVLRGPLDRARRWVRALRVERNVPRVDCVRLEPNPIIGPGEASWMRHAVFDPRPVLFRKQQLVYFCGQPRYDTTAPVYVGVACLDGGRWTLGRRPVIAPDIEQFGIDIPTFIADDEQVCGVYLDFSPARRAEAHRRMDLVIARSVDGVSFAKQVVETPLAAVMRGYGFSRLGLPYLVREQGRDTLYLRAKTMVAGRASNFVVRASIDLVRGRVEVMDATRIDRNPINISVLKRDDLYLLFYGTTIDGGFYVLPSRDGVHWERDREVMLIDARTPLREWDRTKIAAIPHVEGDHVRVYYLAGAGDAQRIGRCELDWPVLCDALGCSRLD